MSEKITFKVETNLQKCHELWDFFSPRKYIYDDWDFRYCFYKYFNYQLHFITAYFAQEPVALLPLEFDNEHGYLEFMAGPFMEYNRVFVKPGFEYLVPELYLKVDNAARLEQISKEGGLLNNFVFDIKTYLLDLRGLNSLAEYLNRDFNSKRRNDFSRAIKKVYQMGVVEILPGEKKDLELLFSFNRKRFHKESSFEEENEENIFRDLLELGDNYSILKIVIDGKIRAVSLAVLYNKRYEYLAVGTDIEFVSNIGTLINLENIRKAIHEGAEFMDFGYDNCNWKEMWHLQIAELYKCIIG